MPTGPASRPKTVVADNEPLTSRQITEAWMRERELRTDDATFVLIRKRIGACLTPLKEGGLAEGVGLVGGYVAWRITT